MKSTLKEKLLDRLLDLDDMYQSCQWFDKMECAFENGFILVDMRNTIYKFPAKERASLFKKFLSAKTFYTA